MKNTKNNVQAILDDMRRITILTGEISSVHEASLLKWPYIIFDNINDVKINYDLSKVTFQYLGKNLREFHIHKSQDKLLSQEELDKRSNILKTWAEDMFWPNIEIKVYINEELKFKSIIDSDLETRPQMENR